ncbi:MAG: hypothetical protein HY021_09470 [Burkholderiales bacterium]|nr:hypothetical protein [Burkholderiales bacterium]
MWHRWLVLTGVLAALAVVGCDKKAEAPAMQAAASGPAGPTPLTPGTATIPPPDVGKLATEKVTANGYGSSASEAVAEAMRLAILQVNGASVDVATVNAKLGIDVTLNQTSASMRADVFGDAVRQRSGGVVQNFRVTELSEPLLPKGKFKATIEANIAKFNAPASLNKVKVVVAPLRFDKPTLPMGDRAVPVGEVGAELRQRIVDALVNTGRFAVLDREFSPELQQELDMIAGGESPRAEMAKLSQAVSADLLWIGKINTLAYNRHARQLRTSDRELVSYSGGWSISQKLVNVATRQVVTSETLRGDAPSTGPTTLGTGVDTRKILDFLTRELVDQVVATILNRTFPITVVAMEGPNVVLSQGGQAMRPGARYAMVVMGTELKDPQTGQSLGRMESPCCMLVIDRVTPHLSYGHLESVQGALDNLLPGALQVREQLKGGPMAPAMVDAQGVPPPPPGPPPRGGRPARAAEPDMPAPVQSPDRKKDEKW